MLKANNKINGKSKVLDNQHPFYVDTLNSMANTYERSENLWVKNGSIR